MEPEQAGPSGEESRMNTIHLIMIVSFAFAASLGSVGLIRRWALEKAILDIPNERSSHLCPTPRGGGLAVSMLLAGSCVALLFGSTQRAWPELYAILAGLVLISAAGWLDDIRSVPNRYRFAVQILSAALVVFSGNRWGALTIPAFGQISLGWLGIPASLVWIVGLTNAYNFMDGVDGMAGAQAVAVGFGWAVLGWMFELPEALVLGLVTGGANLGFLFYNWQPARIFMGDVGSTTLGFLFAVLPLSAARADDRLAVMGLLMVWPFVFDTLFTFLRRLKNREDVFSAHRSHLYQRLVISGYSHRFVTLMYGCFSLTGWILGFAWLIGVPEGGSAVISCIPALAVILMSFVAHTTSSPVASISTR